MLRVRAHLLAAAVALAVAGASPGFAEVVAVTGDAPTVTIDVPDAFQTTKTARGIKAKTADDAVWIFFEIYTPDDRDAVVKEHDEYWASQGVEPGADPKRAEDTSGNTKVIATDYPNATWKGKPTVLRYLFIDPGLASKKLILMSLWASPEGDKAHDGEVRSMIGSMKIRE